MYFCGYRFGSEILMKDLGQCGERSYPGTTPNIFTDSCGFAQLSKTWKLNLIDNHV